MKKIFLIVLGFIYFFVSYNLVLAGEMPDWPINFTWNDIAVVNGGQYNFQLNINGSINWFWPAGNLAFGEVYKGTLHNSTLVIGHSLGNSGQLLYQIDRWPDYGHYFIVVHIISPWGDLSPIINWFENGTGSAPDHWGMIEFDLEEGSLSTKAASLAKQVVNHPGAYLFGGKGWDYNLKEFVTPANVLSGYNYKKDTFGIGLDCSGLTVWTYDRSLDKTKPASDNFVKALNADEQYRYNTELITESELKLGDVLFFDFDPIDGPNHIDHVEMYVGESGGGYDIVNAASPTQGIIFAHKDIMMGLPEFRGLRRVIPATPLAMLITSYSPVDLIVADPDGRYAVIPVATAALARAGSGDVLAGAITGLLGQGLEPYQAAVAGAWIHGRAGMIAQEELGSSATVMAGDILDSIPDVYYELNS